MATIVRVLECFLMSQLRNGIIINGYSSIERHCNKYV